MIIGIIACFGALLIQASSTESSQSAKQIIELGKEYHACIDLNAIIFEKAKEPALDTVEAVFASCSDERAELTLVFLNLRQKTNPDYSVADAEEFVQKMWVESKRKEVLVDFFERRSGFRK
jgi:hypothetical protein